MILTKVDYFENKGQDNYWEIKDVNLGMFSLIIGQNATGKTRLVNVISGFAKMLSKKIPLIQTGNWNLKFRNQTTNVDYEYHLNISKGVVNLEEVKLGKKLLLKRQKEQGELFSNTKNKMIPFNPPEDELTVHVRRDVKEFPFLEDFLRWSNNFHGYSFTNVKPDHITIPGKSEILLEDLSTTPYLLIEALKTKDIIKTIKQDFSSIGYPIKRIAVNPKKITGASNDILFATVWENDLSCTTDQLSMSQGMYRAFSLIIIIEYLLRLKKECTVVIDDLGEGLDYQRSSKIIDLLIEKLDKSQIQLITTSNDRFLINAVDLKNLNLLERKGHFVFSYNYKNSKEKFDEFVYTGLSNFDFFSGKMYKEWSQS